MARCSPPSTKPYVVLRLDDVAHRARDGDAARFGQALDAGGDVHAIAEDVPALRIDDDLAEMHADAQHQSPLLVQHGVEARHALLDVDRRRDRGEGRLEFGQQGIARVVDQRAAGDRDGRPPKLGLCRFEMPDGEVLVALHHADETGDVGMKDRGKTALRGGHCETVVNIRLVETLRHDNAADRVPSMLAPAPQLWHRFGTPAALAHFGYRAECFV